MVIQFLAENVVRGANSVEMSFDPTPALTQRIISGSAVIPSTVDDAMILTTTAATVVDDGLISLDGALSSDLLLTSTDEEVAVVSQQGEITQTGPGVCNIRMRSNRVTKVVGYNGNARGGETVEEFDEYVAGSLGHHIAGTVDTKIAASFPYRRNLFSSMNHVDGIYVRDEDHWLSGVTGIQCIQAALLLPGQTTWNQQYGVTPLTPRHFITVNHYLPPVGTIVRFVTLDNVVVERTVTDHAHAAPLGDSYAEDYVIGKFDSDLPGSIGFLKVPPADFVDSYVPSLRNNSRLPGLAVAQNKLVYVVDYVRAQDSLDDWIRILFGIIHPSRATFGSSATSGDSGGFSGFIINGELVAARLVGGATFLGAGAITAINLAITNLGGGYQLTLADLDDFTDFS